MELVNPFVLDVCYDSGSSAMAIRLRDLVPYMTPNGPDLLRQKDIIIPELQTGCLHLPNLLEKQNMD